MLRHVIHHVHLILGGVRGELSDCDGAGVYFGVQSELCVVLYIILY